MYEIVFSRNFRRSLKKLQRSGMLGARFKARFALVVDALSADEILPDSFHDHALAGELSKYRECHLKGDLLLIYRRHEDKMIIELTDIGSHSHLFE